MSMSLLIRCVFAILMASICCKAEAQKLHLLIAADTTDPEIFCKPDIGTIYRLFQSNTPEGLCEIKILEGKKLTKAAMLSAINSFNVSEKDALIVYYSGHGAFQRKGGQFIVLPDDTHLYRSRLKEWILSRNPRLGVLLTDTCSNVVGDPTVFLASAVNRPEKVSKLFGSLFFENSGYADLSGSSPGEYGYGTPNGGVFTLALAKFVRLEEESQISWEPFVRRLRATVQEEFDLWRKKHGVTQKDLTLRAYSIPFSESDGAHEKLTFGVGVVAENGRLRIAKVVPGTPATDIRLAGGASARLEKGDVLLAINGRKISTSDEYLEAIEVSPKQMRFSLLDSRTGNEIQCTVQLNK